MACRSSYLHPARSDGSLVPNLPRTIPVQGALDAARLVNRSIESLQASHAPDVVLIYIPDRWEAFRSYSTETENFDLHNFVKAFCVQRGIATQFLNQDTLSDTYQCRIWWWLSLALYVKGMRTPWVLDNRAHSRFPGHALTPTGVMAIRCKQFHLPDL